MTQLVIVGLGLIGGSIGLGARKNQLFERIVGVDQGGLKQQAHAHGVVDELIPLEDVDAVDAALRAASLCVLSAPVRAIEGWLARALAAGPIVTDCGSTKRSILTKTRRLENATRFVAGHPMAGHPAGGLSAARADLFQGQRWILCPRGTDEGSLREVERLVIGLGARVVHMEPEQHDHAVAVTSHLPQLIASQLLVMTDRAGAMDASGSGFAAATRVAGGPPEVWRDIFATNADEVGDALGVLCRDLSMVAEGLNAQPADVEPALAVLARARRLRKP